MLLSASVPSRLWLLRGCPRQKFRGRHGSGKAKHININKFAGLSRDWVGADKLFMFFFPGHSLWGRETHKQNSPKILGQSRDNYVYLFFSLCVFSLPNGGVVKRGGWKTSRMTPLPKRGFGPPLVRYVLGPPQVSVLCFSYKNPRQGRPETLMEGSKNFRESAFSDTFSSPHTFCTPPYHGPRSSRRKKHNKRNILHKCSLHRSAPGKWGRPRRGQAVLKQTLTRFHGIRFKSG